MFRITSRNVPYVAGTSRKLTFRNVPNDGLSADMERSVLRVGTFHIGSERPGNSPAGTFRY